MSTPLEITLGEGLAILRLITEPYTSRYSNVEKLRIKVMDAVVNLERGAYSPFAFDSEEEELWFIDQVLQEDSKDIVGSSLRELRRKVWKSLLTIHAEEVLQIPLFNLTDGDITYKEARDASS